MSLQDHPSKKGEAQAASQKLPILENHLFSFKRRHLFKLGFSCAALFWGLSFFFRFRYSDLYAPNQPLQFLKPYEYDLVRKMADCILEGDGEDAPSPSELEVAEYIDKYLASPSIETKQDVRNFLMFIEHGSSFFTGKVNRFTSLSKKDRNEVLYSLSLSSVPLIREALLAIKSLFFMAYYRHPKTWKIIAYDGPLLGRATKERSKDGDASLEDLTPQ